VGGGASIAGAVDVAYFWREPTCVSFRAVNDTGLRGRCAPARQEKLEFERISRCGPITASAERKDYAFLMFAQYGRLVTVTQLSAVECSDHGDYGDRQNSGMSICQNS